MSFAGNIGSFPCQACFVEPREMLLFVHLEPVLLSNFKNREFVHVMNSLSFNAIKFVYSLPRPDSDPPPQPSLNQN
jgi:hypothetical protein